MTFLELVQANVEAEDVTRNLQTSLTEEDVDALIERAANRVAGMVRACGTDPDTLTELDGLLEDAVIQFAQSYLVDFDGSAGGYATERREGRKAVRYSASTAKLGDSLRSDAADLVVLWCSEHGTVLKASGAVRERRIRGANTRLPGAVSSRRDEEADF